MRNGGDWTAHDAAPAGADAPRRDSVPDRDVVPFVAESIARVRDHGHVGPRRRTFGASPASGNQFCLFLKPWTTNPGVDLPGVIDVVLDRIAAHGLAIDEAAVLPGAYLRAERIAAAHYWRMTGLARDPAARLSADDWARFHDAFGGDADRDALLGGFAFLDRVPGVSAQALEILWENLPQHRLGKSIACARVALGNAAIFLVNGFVPHLLQGYERPDAVVVAFSLSGPLAWRDARHAFIGHTDPSRAAPGSLRRTLFARQAQLGIADLRLGANGAHLSAGPVEALVELQRLMSAGPADLRTPTDFLLGRQLAAHFDAAAIDAMLANPDVDTAQGRLSLFDLTEETDGRDAVALLSALRDRFTPPLPHHAGP